MSNAEPRGLFLVIEGIDGSGKSTLCSALTNKLNESGIDAVYWSFPSRMGVIGGILDSYLHQDGAVSNMSDYAMHLLFSADRWDTAAEIVEQLESGMTVVCDRYAYSGAAYSMAKGLPASWCKNCDAGLPEPDAVFFLDLAVDTALERIEKRAGTRERFEKKTTLELVRNAYRELKPASRNWHTIDASKNPQMVADIASQTALLISERTKTANTDVKFSLWLDE